MSWSRIMSSPLCQSPSAISSSPPWGGCRALLTTASMRPQRSSVAPTTLPSTPGSVFEPVKPSPPSDLPRASPLPEADMTATLYPCAASSRAQPAPMPLPAAVMIATLPSVMPTIVPRIVGKIRRRHAVEVRDVEFLRRNTERIIKITLPGPFTMAQQVQNDHYADETEVAIDYAVAVNEEAHALKAAGADIVQLDEPWLQARA